MSDKQTDIDLFIPDEPPPYWRGSPWASAIESLFFGDTKFMAELLERGTPIPPELGKVLAIALRGGDGLPFHFKLVPNPKPGGNRAGRWPVRKELRDMCFAVEMAKRMEEFSYEEAAIKVADGTPINARTVKAAYTKYRDMVPEWRAWAAEMAEITKKAMSEPLETTPPEPPLAKWMVKGDQ